MQTYPPAAVRPASAIHAQRTQSHTHYERRRPEITVLHTLVRENIDTFLDQVKTESGSALPPHVEKEFDDYLRCGVLAHGFLWLRCGCCNEENLVGFSWQLLRIYGPLPVCKTHFIDVRQNHCSHISGLFVEALCASWP